MTDIKVIERPPEERLLSREEREARLQEVAAQSKIPRYHFDNFLELEDEVIATESRRKKPDITALLVRKLLNYDTVLPIVSEKVNRLKDLDAVNSFFNIPTLRKFGSAAPAKKPKAKTKPETKPAQAPATGYAMSVRTDKKKFVHLNELKKFVSDDLGNKHMYQSGKGETLEISGILINHNSPVMRYFRDKYPWSMSAISVIMSGSYSAEYIHNRLFSPFRVTDQKLFTRNMKELIPGALQIGDYYYYLFGNENNAKQVCTSLLEYMHYLEQIWASSQINDIITHAFHTSENIAETPISAMPKFSELFKLIVTMLTKFQELSSPIKEMVDTKFVISKDLIDFIKQVAPYMPRGERSIHFQSSLYHDFWIANLLVLLEKFLMSRGKTTATKAFVEELRTFVTNQTKQGFQKAKQQQHCRRIFEAKLVEMRYRWIFIQKFGWDKFQEIYKDQPKNQPVRSLVQKSTRDILETTFAKIEKYAEAVRRNTCPHLAIESAMRTTDSVAVRSAKYEELKKYMPVSERKLSRGIQTDHISCINCKFNLICPHVRDMMELEKTRKTDDEVRQFIFKYAGDVPLYLQYYCRICGEPIADTTEVEGVVAFIGGQKVEFGRVDDELRDNIWKEASFLVRNFVTFKGVQTNKYINRFVTSLVNGVYEFIFAIDKKLSKSKTSSVEETANKKKLFTIVYVMALLAKVISENHKRIKFEAKKHRIQGLKTSFVKTPVGKLIGQAFSIVTGSQNVLMNKIEGMSPTVIRNSLLKAYKVLSKLLRKSTIPKPKESELIVTLLLDPLYKYIVETNIRIKADGFGQGKKSSEFKKIKENLVDPRVSLGRTVKELEKSEYVFENIREPKLIGGTDAFDDLITKGVTTAPDKLYKAYWNKSFQHTFEYLHSRVYINPLWDVELVGDDEELKIEINKRYAEYFAKFDEIARAERILYDLIMYQNMRSFWQLPMRKSQRFVLPKNPESYLAQVYGDQFNSKFNFKAAGIDLKEVKKSPGFHSHKWDLITYRIGSTSRTFHRKDMAKKLQLENQSKEAWLPEDVVCSVCFHAKSEIRNIIKDPVTLLEKHQQLESFYNYFAAQCPKPTPSQLRTGDNLHQFNNDKCSNCGYTKDLALSLNKGYFDKWKSKFAAADDDVASKSAEDETLTSKDWSKVVALPAAIKNPKIGDDVRKWKYNQNAVTELVNATYEIIGKKMKYKKPHYFNIWINLGLTYGLDFEDIVSGKETPYRNITTNTMLARTRENQIGAYVHKFIVNYNTMRNYKNITSLPLEIKELVSNAGLGKVLRKLPTFATDYHGKVRQLRMFYYKEEDVYHRANFNLEFLCRALLKLIKAHRKEISPFIAYFVSEIIDAEKAMSKPKAARMAQILAAQKASAEDHAAMQDNRTSRAFDGITDESKDRYSMEGMDYDGHNDDINT